MWSFREQGLNMGVLSENSKAKWYIYLRCFLVIYLGLNYQSRMRCVRFCNRHVRVFGESNGKREDVRRHQELQYMFRIALGLWKLNTPTMYVFTKLYDVFRHLFRYCCGLDHVEFPFQTPKSPLAYGHCCSPHSHDAESCIGEGKEGGSNHSRIVYIHLSGDSTVLLIANVQLLFLPKALQLWAHDIEKRKLRVGEIFPGKIA